MKKISFFLIYESRRLTHLHTSLHLLGLLSVTATRTLTDRTLFINRHPFPMIQLRPLAIRGLLVAQVAETINALVTAGDSRPHK